MSYKELVLGLWLQDPHMNVSEFGFVGQKSFLTKGNKNCPARIPSGCKIAFSQAELCQARIHMPVKPMAHFPVPALPRELGVLFGHSPLIPCFCIRLSVLPSPGRAHWDVLS